MKHLLKTLISALLTASAITSAAAAAGCAGTGTGAAVSTSAAPDTSSAETAAETDEFDARQAVSDSLPDADYQGYKFNILTYSPTVYCVEEQTGDALTDVIYSRNVKVEDRFNCEIAVTASPGIVELDKTFKNGVMAGDAACDIAIPHQITSGPGFITSHCIADWNSVPTVDLSKPWWNQTIDKTINILGHQYYIAGQLTMPDPFCMFFNKAYVANYGLSDIYTMVDEHRFTLDALLDMTKATSADINGDGKFDETDQYGITFNNDNQTLNYMYASDICSVVLDDTGYPQPNVSNDKMLTLVNKVYSLIYEDSRTLFTNYQNQDAVGKAAFRDGRTMFIAGSINYAVNFRDAEIDFGLIPYPLFDESQEAYHTHVDAWNGMLCIPVTASDLARTGVICEAMCEYTYKDVMPVYFNVCLGEKYLRDEESVHMLDYVYDGIIYDFGYIFDSWKGCTWTLPNMMQAKSTNLASYWAKKEKQVEANYKKLYEAVSEG